MPPLLCTHTFGWIKECILLKEEGWWMCTKCWFRKKMTLNDCNWNCNWNCSHTKTGSTSTIFFGNLNTDL
jgi:hypothetical protein